MSCRLSLSYASKRIATGWRVSIRAEGLPDVQAEALTSEEANTAAYAQLQHLADESEARGQPLNFGDYAVSLEFDPEEVLQ